MYHSLIVKHSLIDHPWAIPDIAQNPRWPPWAQMGQNGANMKCITCPVLAVLLKPNL